MRNGTFAFVVMVRMEVDVQSEQLEDARAWRFTIHPGKGWRYEYHDRL